MLSTIALDPERIVESRDDVYSFSWGATAGASIVIPQDWVHYFYREILPSIIEQVYGVGISKKMLLCMDTFQVVLSFTLIRKEGRITGYIWYYHCKKNNKSVNTLGTKKNDRKVVHRVCTRSAKHHCHSPVIDIT